MMTKYPENNNKVNPNYVPEPSVKKKQYWLSNEYNFKHRVILFEDNEPVKVYEGFRFEAFKFCCEAERKGYKEGYLPPRVEEALKTYKSIVDNKIEFNEDPWKIEVRNDEQE